MADGAKLKPREEASPNDVGLWGEKDVDGAYSGPLNIAGEKVDLASTPAFGDGKGPSPKVPLKP